VSLLLFSLVTDAPPPAPRLLTTSRGHARLDWHQLPSFISTLKTRQRRMPVARSLHSSYNLLPNQILIPKYSLFHYSENHAGSKQPTDHELRQCLNTMLALPHQAPIYIVMDALDECPNSTGTPSPRENVLRLVEWLLSLRCSNLWVSVTSRPEPDIAAVLRSLASRTISLHNETGQTEDITNYIKWFVNSDPMARKWRKTRQKNSLSRSSQQELMGL